MQLPNEVFTNQMSKISNKPIRVTIWNEFIHERQVPEVTKLYPQGIHKTIADSLNSQEIHATTAHASRIGTGTLR